MFDVEYQEKEHHFVNKRAQREEEVSNLIEEILNELRDQLDKV
jgi:hypothetical protein